MDAAAAPGRNHSSSSHVCESHYHVSPMREKQKTVEMAKKEDKKEIVYCIKTLYVLTLAENPEEFYTCFKNYSQHVTFKCPTIPITGICGGGCCTDGDMEASVLGFERLSNINSSLVASGRAKNERNQFRRKDGKV